MQLVLCGVTSELQTKRDTVSVLKKTTALPGGRHLNQNGRLHVPKNPAQRDTNGVSLGQQRAIAYEGFE